MRPLRSLCIYLIVVFGTGGLLAPWLDQLASWGASRFPAFEPLARYPFHRFVNRSLLLLGVLSLWPFLKSIGMTSWRNLGLKPAVRPWEKIGQGFLLGFGSLAIVALISVVAGARILVGGQTGAEILRHLANAGLAALFVASFEEVFFRGALFGAMRRTLAWPAALVFSSGFYALVHFFERTESPASIHWWSGLAVIGQMMQGFGDWQKLAPGFFNLTLAGVILGLGYQFTESLHFSIGLHAGWIFWLKSYGFVTQPSAEANVWFWGTGRLIDGWLASAVLAAILLLLLKRPCPGWRRADTPQSNPPG